VYKIIGLGLLVSLSACASQDIVQPQHGKITVYENHCDKGYSMGYFSYEGDIFDSSTLAVCISDTFKKELTYDKDIVTLKNKEGKLHTKFVKPAMEKA